MSRREEQELQLSAGYSSHCYQLNSRPSTPNQRGFFGLPFPRSHRLVYSIPSSPLEPPTTQHPSHYTLSCPLLAPLQQA